MADAMCMVGVADEVDVEAAEDSKEPDAPTAYTFWEYLTSAFIFLVFLSSLHAIQTVLRAEL